MHQLPPLHHRQRRVGFRRHPMGDVLVRLPALGRPDRPANPRGHRRAQLPETGTAGLLSAGPLQLDVGLLEARGELEAQIRRHRAHFGRLSAGAGAGENDVVGGAAHVDV